MCYLVDIYNVLDEAAGSTSGCPEGGDSLFF